MPRTDSNPVGTLQEHAQSKGGTFPQYRLLEAMGESHCPNFTMEVKFGEFTAEGMATNKKLAKHEAARNMLGIINGEYEATGLDQCDVENTTNQEKPSDKTSEVKDETDDKPTVGQTVYAGNKIGELQEYCMGHGLGMPTYTDGETTGPSHMRHFTMLCVMGSVERVGEGGTKKEAKRQAAGAVLEVISSPVEKTTDTNVQDQNETKVNTDENENIQNKEKEHQKKEDYAFIDNACVGGLQNCENNVDAKEQNGHIVLDKDVMKQKLEELNTGILEDHDHENTPEEVDE